MLNVHKFINTWNKHIQNFQTFFKMKHFSRYVAIIEVKFAHTPFICFSLRERVVKALKLYNTASHFSESKWVVHVHLSVVVERSVNNTPRELFELNDLNVCSVGLET